MRSLRNCQEAFFNSLPSKFSLATTVFFCFEVPFDRRCGVKEKGGATFGQKYRDLYDGVRILDASLGDVVVRIPKSVSFHLSRIYHLFVALYLLKSYCLINFSIRKT